MDLRSRRKILQTGVAAALFAASGLPVGARGKSGRLRVGLSDPISTVEDRIRSDLSVFSATAGQGSVFDTLTEVSSNGALRGELARDWSASQNATVWTLSLRTDVRFHDGSLFSADDVATAFAYHRSASQPAPILETISGIEVLSSDAIRFKLKAPNPDFPWFLSDPSLVVFRPDADEDWVGTGLYRAERPLTGERLLAQRVSDHYKDGRAGWFDGLELLSIPDDSARVSALLSGRIDVTHDLLPASIAQLRVHPRFKLHVIPKARYIAFECRGEAPAELRAALAQSVDREKLVGEALGDIGSVAYDLPIPVRANPFEAAQDTEMPRRISIALSSDLGSSGTRVVATLSRHLRMSGTEVSLASDAAQADVIARRLPVRPLEDWAWLDWAAYAGGRSTELKGALEEARACTHPMERAEKYQHAAAVVSQTSNVFIPCFNSNVIAYHKDLSLEGLPARGLDLDGARIAERWWRA